MKYSPKELELLDLDILKFFEYKYSIPKSKLFDNEIYYQFYNSPKRYNLAKGGRGSGKSKELVGKLPIVYISCEPFRRFAIVRQYYNSIEGSAFQEIIDYLDDWKLSKYFKINKRPAKITHLESGNFIQFAGMDKPDSIKGIKDATDVIFEEAFQIKDARAVDVVQKSIRTPKVNNHRFYFIFNPDHTDHWIYHRFYDEQYKDRFEYYRDRALKVTTTYRDNKFLPQGFIDQLEADRKADPERAKVDADGEWGNIKKHGLFYPNFDNETHVKHGLKGQVYDKDMPLYLTFDFNVYPYISLEIAQYRHNSETNEVEFCVIDEICLHEQKYGTKAGRTEETCKVFLERYYAHTGKVYVCGDRSGANRKTTGVADYATIFSMLSKTKPQQYQKVKEGSRTITKDPFPEYASLGCVFKVVDKTIKSQNPRLDARNLFCKRLMAGTLTVLPADRRYGTAGRGGKRPLSAKYSGCRISLLVDSNCYYLIKDYNEVLQKENGQKDSGNPELTHTSDAMDYLITTFFDAEFKKSERDLTRKR